MINFFASLYEWWGLNPFYSSGLGDFLRGWDITGTGFLDTPWYLYIGMAMMGTTAFIYALQYHIIDSTRFMRRYHWWSAALVIFILNYLIAFVIPFNTVQAGEYDPNLRITTADCIGFGLSNAFWSLILFAIITSVPWLRNFSTNCRHTTFWKP